MAYNAGCPTNMHMVPSEQNSPQYPRSFTLPRDAGVIVDTMYGPVLMAKNSVPSDNFSESSSNQIQLPSLGNQYHSSSSKMSNGSGGPTFDETLPEVLESDCQPVTSAVPRMRSISSAPPVCQATSSSEDSRSPLQRFSTTRSDGASMMRFATTRSDDANLDSSPTVFAPPLFLPQFSETTSPSMIYTPTLVPLASTPNIAVSPGNHFLVPMTPVFCSSPSLSPATSPNFAPMSMPHVQPMNFSLSPTHFKFKVDDTPRQNSSNAHFGMAGSEEYGSQTLYSLFVDLGPKLLDRIEKDCIREGHRLSRKDVSEIHQLRQEMIENFHYWNEKDAAMVEHYIEVVHSMANLIGSEAKRGKKPLHQLAHRFRTCSLPYLRRENFETRGALELGEYDMRRSVLLYIRLFKNIQLMRFKDFRCTLRSPEGTDADKLQGKWVIRNRCKRMESFSAEAHVFDAFMHDLIISGGSGVVDMHICKDHKPQQAKHKHKERVIGGLLIYFVCATNDLAEQLLRQLVTYCEGGHTTKEHKMRQRMFRKHQSLKKCNPEEDLQKRHMLLAKQKWSASDFEMQKKMYHFTLAIPDDNTRRQSSFGAERLQQPPVRITSLSPSPQPFRAHQSSTLPISRPRSRRGSFNQPGVGSAGF